jgi:hypothetical protein
VKKIAQGVTQNLAKFTNTTFSVQQNCPKKFRQHICIIFIKFPNIKIAKLGKKCAQSGHPVRGPTFFRSIFCVGPHNQANDRMQATSRYGLINERNRAGMPDGLFSNQKAQFG